ncbi:hypothetical protein PLESTB_000989100 [Pleodorina starrii]|uniref:Uncharacterized protein n=1 Tax=Pleodorina starrii TaxID=330485 RepID=A0A9W6F4K1_9CHLO|nr:hypothetical protein PLESTM_000551700 [Pleodorina starrii]GLC55456.1 hypothetical protein PLESTB_000989100 [Pleodorina starrii]GLC73848.1 hypothetical protein PLESTF_001427500 [Pleodorina starrii]
MAASTFSLSRSAVCASTPVRGLARGGPRFACRLSVVRAQSHNNASAAETDLVKGCAAPGVAGLAVSALVSTAAARAEDVTEATAAAGAASSAAGFGAGEAVLLLTPVVVYALFNVYREKLNPQAKFLDYVYIMAALAIFGNIFSILVFKTRFF